MIELNRPQVKYKPSPSKEPNLRQDGALEEPGGRAKTGQNKGKSLPSGGVCNWREKEETKQPLE